MDGCQWERGRDGSPHARGHGMGEAGLVVGSDRFFTSLRYVQNDMWGALRSEGLWGMGGMGPRMKCGEG